MHIISTYCLHELGYSVGGRECNNETIQRVGVCLNKALRRIFGYRRYESVRTIFFNLGSYLKIYMLQSRGCKWLVV